MKKSSKAAPLHRPGDPPAMTEAIEWCEKRGLAVVRPTDHQVKVAMINFYPNTGTIQVDGKPGLPGGLPAFERVVRELIGEVEHSAPLIALDI